MKAGLTAFHKIESPDLTAFQISRPISSRHELRLTTKNVTTESGE